MSKILPKLYKQDNLPGVISYWTIEIEDDHYRSIFGRVGPGYAEQISDWTTCSGKNIGRANETSPEEQALAEAESKWKHRRDTENSFEDIEDVKNGKKRHIEPMLAHEHSKHAKKVQFPAFVQPKLDGARCVATINGLFSRNGKSFPSCKHIHDFLLANVFSKFPFLILDGELYSHKNKDNFNKIMSAVRTTVNIDFDFVKDNVEYHVYDFIHSKPQNERVEDVEKMFQSFENRQLKNVPLRRVKTLQVSNLKEIDDYHDDFVDQGYEGLIIRKFDGAYEHRRTTSLLKYKRFDDAEFEILDVIEGLGKRSGMAGAIECRTKQGKVFRSGLEGDEEYFCQLLRDVDDIVGKMATIKFFRYTPDGIPRFPVLKAIRDYE